MSARRVLVLAAISAIAAGPLGGFVFGLCRVPQRGWSDQIQALERTQLGLPLNPGRCGTFTHDYLRHGTTTLFAALQVVEGRVIGQYYARRTPKSSRSIARLGTRSTTW